jgi:molybdenum cofactor cytidylyltransferase
MNRICAILLAAGRSRRMGTQKLLLPLAGKTVIAHVVDQLVSAALHPIVVVVRAGDGDVQNALGGRPVQFAFNSDPDGDMLSSVRTGLRTSPLECQAVLVALGDQPALSAQLIREMIDTFAASGRGIVLPVHNGQRGHPLLFSMRYRAEVLRSFDGVGLRGLPAAHEADIAEVQSTDAAILDMDSPDDYQRELRRQNHS